MKPYFEDEHVRIFHADARDLTPAEVGPVACVVTSPPYNVGIDYADHDDVMPWLDYREMADGVAGLMHEVMVDGARSWVNVCPVVQSTPGPGRMPHSGRTAKDRTSLVVEWGNALAHVGLNPVDMIAWTSVRGAGTAWGSYEMPTAPNVGRVLDQITETEGEQQ